MIELFHCHRTSITNFDWKNMFYFVTTIDYIAIIYVSF